MVTPYVMSIQVQDIGCEDLAIYTSLSFSPPVSTTLIADGDEQRGANWAMSRFESEESCLEVSMACPLFSRECQASDHATVP